MAGSTCEAEDMAALEASHEAIGMKGFIADLGVIPNASGPMTLFYDNTGAIALAKEPRFHKKTRHIKRRFNSIYAYGSEYCRFIDQTSSTSKT